MNIHCVKQHNNILIEKCLNQILQNSCSFLILHVFTVHFPTHESAHIFFCKYLNTVLNIHHYHHRAAANSTSKPISAPHPLPPEHFSIVLISTAHGNDSLRRSKVGKRKGVRGAVGRRSGQGGWRRDQEVTGE